MSINKPLIWKNHNPHACKRLNLCRPDTSSEQETFEALPIKTKTINLYHTERFELPDNDYGFIRMFVTFEQFEEPQGNRPATAWVQVKLITEDESELIAEMDMNVGEILSSLNFNELNNLNLDFFKLIDMDPINFSYIIIGEVSQDSSNDFAES